MQKLRNSAPPDQLCKNAKGDSKPEKKRPQLETGKLWKKKKELYTQSM